MLYIIQNVESFTKTNGGILMKKIDDIKALLISGEMEAKFLDIYLDPAKASAQKDRYIKALDSFRGHFGDAAVEIYSAPGRTEVGGNHTDHQHGEVLAASINDDAIAVAAPRDDASVRVLSEGYPMITLSISDEMSPLPEEEGTTAGLIRGMLAGMKDRGYSTGGFDAYITSDVLGGSGLSSSAAFETLIGTILSGLYNEMNCDAVTIAKIGQYAENVYFGKPCGLMDQMACSVGSLCHMNFADPNDPKIERIDFDLSAAGFSLCITDTKGSHADLTPDYAAVPAEMKAVAKYFGKEVLHDVPEELMLAGIPELRAALGDRPVLRAMHFYNECRRVRTQAAALKDNDLELFLQAVKASGDSSFKFLQNVYTSRDVQHQNVSIALSVSEQVLKYTGGTAKLTDTGVARVHGGGFAGTIQAFVPDASVQDYRSAMDKVFGDGACMVLKIRKYGGIKVV